MNSAPRACLCFRGPQCLTAEFIEEAKDVVEEVDLSWNAMSDFNGLRLFSKLTTLLVCHNDLITSNVHFPRITTLETLWVNYCKIDNLASFVEKIVVSFPKLKRLSMLGNDACKNFLNGGSPAEYSDYRKYVIAKLPKLQALDDRMVSEEERVKAQKKYGDRGGAQGLERVLGAQKKKHKRKQQEKKDKEGVIYAEPEHPYARKKELVIPGQSEDPEDEWTTDSEDIDYWKGY